MGKGFEHLYGVLVSTTSADFGYGKGQSGRFASAYIIHRKINAEQRGATVNQYFGGASETLWSSTRNHATQGKYKIKNNEVMFENEAGGGGGLLRAGIQGCVSRDTLRMGYKNRAWVAVPSAASPGAPVLSASSKSEYSSSLRAGAPSATPRDVQPLNVSEYARRARAKVAAPENTTTPESIATSGLGFPESSAGVSLPSGLQGRKAPDVSASWKDGF